MHINSVFGTLHQLGVGPVVPWFIEDETALWSEFIGDRATIVAVRTYMGLKVRMVFDPPTQSFVLTALEKQILEAEWRLNVAAETPLAPPPILVAPDDVEATPTHWSLD